MDSFDAARRFLASLKQTERLPPAALARYQAPLIERICRHAAIETDFNAERLRVLFEGGDPHQGKFLFDNWRQVAPFGRAEAQRDNDALHARRVPEFAGPTTKLRTSGSTGRPLAFGRSAVGEIASLARTEMIFETHRFDPAARMGWIVFVEKKDGWFERETKGWSLRDPEGPLFMLSKAASMAQCVAWLRRLRPRYLMSQPSVVAGIIEELRHDGGDPVRLERVLVTSEAAPDGLTEDVAAVFGGRLIDNYGGREVGEIACTCPGNGPAKHMAADTMLVEILKPDGEPAAPGEMGAVVVTPFYAYATPLIRYDIGDFAIQGPASCPCGRTLPLIERVLGRQHALFRFSDGTTRFPVGLNGIRRHLPWLQMQVVQTHLDRVQVRYVPDPNGGAPDLAAAARMALRGLHPDVTVEFIAVETIDHSPSGKFEDIVSLVDR